jgi:hypothetical protein
MIDSAGYHLLRGGGGGLRATLERQIVIAADEPLAILWVLDVPLPPRIAKLSRR